MGHFQAHSHSRQLRLSPTVHLWAGEGCGAPRGPLPEGRGRCGTHSPAPISPCCGLLPRGCNSPALQAAQSVSDSLLLGSVLMALGHEEPASLLPSPPHRVLCSRIFELLAALGKAPSHFLLVLYPLQFLFFILQITPHLL